MSREAYEELQARKRPPEFAAGAGLKVGIWIEGYGGPPILQALQEVPGLQVKPVYLLSAEMLAPCEVFVLPQPKSPGVLNKAADALRQFVQRGGGLYLTHDAVGARDMTALFPAAVSGHEVVNARAWQFAAKSPIKAELPAGKTFQHTFYDRIPLRVADASVVVATTDDGQPLVAALTVGRGRVVANGMALGLTDGNRDCPPSEPERKLLIACVKWLGGK